MNQQQRDDIDIIKAQVEQGGAAIVRLVKELGEDGQKTIRIERQAIAPEPPVRAESQARAHTINDIDDLCSYLTRYGTTGHIVVAINLQGRCIEACLNEQAEKGVEELRYEPRYTRQWESFLSLLGRKLAARELSLKLRELAPCIVEPDATTVRHMTGQLSVAKEVEDLSSTGTKGTFGRMVKVVARTGDGTPFQVPDRLRVAIKPYVDTPEPVEFEVFLDLVPCNEKNVAFELQCPDAGHVFEAAMLARRDRIEEELAEREALVVFGSLERCAWDYLKA